MLLTTKQVAQKLGVHPRVVRGLITRNLLKPANEPKPNAHKTVWEFDSKLVNDFKQTYVPVVRGPRKPKGNGHAPEPLPLDIPSAVQLFNYLTGTRVELGTRLGIIEEKLAKLMAVWGVE